MKIFKIVSIIVLVVFMAINVELPLAHALSPDQKALFDEGIDYYDLYSNTDLSPGVGGLVGSSCYNVTLPTINDPSGLAKAINQFVNDNSGKGTPFDGLGDKIVEGATRAGVNPMLVVSIALHESGFGKATPPGTNNSFGRTATDSQPHVFYGDRNWYKWSSFAASVDSTTENDEPTYINDMYVSQGLTTLTAMIYKYAPPSENATQDYIKFLQKEMGEIVADAGSAISCGLSGSVSTSGFTFYSQYDPAWINDSYGSSTIGPSGCGPTSMAMAVTNLTGQSITPDIIAKEFGRDFIPGAGSSWSLFSDVASKYHLQANNIGTNTAKAAKSLTAGSLVVITGTGTSPFTGGGHILLLRGVTNDGNFVLADPNTTVPPAKDPENSNPISEAKLVGAGLKNMWVISK